MDILKRQPVNEHRPHIDPRIIACRCPRRIIHAEKRAPRSSKMANMSTLSPLEDAKRAVKPAKLLANSRLFTENGYMINELRFSVPIDHRPKDAKDAKDAKEGEEICVTVRVVVGHSGAKEETLRGKGLHLNETKPFAVYLVGGPGSDNPPAAHTCLNEFYLDKGFQVLYMDYRGMGQSTLLRADHLSETTFPTSRQRGEPTLQGLKPQAQADRLALFRQDNIVRDLEAVRMALFELGYRQARKWTLVGQSYGGWISFTYLSLYPESLHMVIVTGGIPPVGQEADTVYKSTYKTLIKACNDFYGIYPQHEANMREILQFIAEKSKDASGKTVGIKMPGGGVLTPERFLCLGRKLGTTGGYGKVDKALTMCMADMKKGALSQATLADIDDWLRFEERPLYAILQEPIYTEPGMQAAGWSAEKIGKSLPEYWWLNDHAFGRVFSGQKKDAAFREEHYTGKPIYMSAEHIYRFHFDQFHALVPLKEAANILAQKTDWPPLYDCAQLARNEVPISALSYERDMFIDWRLSQKTVNGIPVKNIVSKHDKELMHTAVKDQPDAVLPRVWSALAEAVGNKIGRGLKDEEGRSAQSLIALLEKA
ncbi:hypothetical protein SCUCBS95973_000227 [Sporothrix curviconia]|uniref:AB hydrolase-1 domain-containing protein n=1 Tax=Sporothrix curviconia TaxID=1260050 RepID=A0ABP0ANI5_9PEZI